MESELLQAGGTAALILALALAVRFQTSRLVAAQQEQVALLKGALAQNTAALMAVKDAMDACRARQTAPETETRHFRKPKP